MSDFSFLEERARRRNIPLIPVRNTMKADFMHVYPRSKMSRLPTKKVRGKSMRVDWLWALMRKEFLRQQCNVVVIPDVELAAVFWGGRPLPKKWRHVLKAHAEALNTGKVSYIYLNKGTCRYGKRLPDFGICPVLPKKYMKHVLGDDTKKNDLKFELGSPLYPSHVLKNKKCPSSCFLLPHSNIKHAHFVFYIPTPYLGVFHTNLTFHYQIAKWVDGRPINFYYPITRKTTNKRLVTTKTIKGSFMYAEHEAMALFARAAFFTNAQFKLYSSIYAGVSREKNRIVYKRQARPDKAKLVHGKQGPTPNSTESWVSANGTANLLTGENIPLVIHRMFHATYVKDKEIPTTITHELSETVKDFLEDLIVLMKALVFEAHIVSRNKRLHTVKQTFDELCSCPAQQRIAMVKDICRSQLLIFWPEDYITSFKEKILARAHFDDEMRLLMAGTYEDLSTSIVPPNEDFVVTIKRALKQKGMTQGELAKQVGVSAVMLSHYLTGKYKPKENILKKMKQILDIS